MNMENINMEEKLKELGLELPQAPKVQLARDLVAQISERFAERAKPRLASISA